MGSNATFKCVTNETTSHFWLINGYYPYVFNISAPIVYPYTTGVQSTLVIFGDYEMDGSSIICWYQTQQGKFACSPSAFLAVQGMRK